MERLTKRDKDGTAIAPEFADKTYIMQDDHDKFTGYINSPIVDRLAELEDKLESGQLLELPCAIGDKIFIIHLPKLQHELIECVIARMEFTGNGLQINLCESGFGTRSFVCFYDCKDKTFSKGVLGYKVSYPQDIVFTDKSKAEARLKELQEQKND